LRVNALQTKLRFNRPALFQQIISNQTALNRHFLLDHGNFPAGAFFNTAKSLPSSRPKLFPRPGAAMELFFLVRGFIFLTTKKYVPSNIPVYTCLPVVNIRTEERRMHEEN